MTDDEALKKDHMNTPACSHCGQPTPTPSYGCNLLDVTDGPVYLCASCCPPAATAEEAIECLVSFMVPPVEGESG